MRSLFIFYLIGIIWPVIISEVSAGRRQRLKEPEKTQEVIFMENYFPVMPCGKWEEGKEFVYLDTELTPLLQTHGSVMMQKDISFRGKIFTYEGLVETSPWRKGAVDLCFDCEGTKFYFRTGKTEEEIKSSSYAPLMPMLVAQSDIARAQMLLVGKTLYTRPAIWIDSIGNTSSGGRYCPVKILDIEPGNTVYPIAFVFQDDMGVTYRVFGSLTQTSNVQAATFDRLFTFDNPRNLYKEISDKHWQMITHGRVVAGMTKEECRLSLGSPQTAREIPTYSGLKEEWYYQTGAYLYFEDGILSRYR